MSSLPEEIYLDILLRVPARSKFVCKCVCKTWLKLISDPDFDKMHLNHRTQTNNYSLMMKSNDGYCLYLCSDSLLSSSNVLIELEPPYKYLRSNSTDLLGSCNGLVYGRNCHLKFFFLWNPATKEYKKLSRSEVREFHGFGYDYKMEDYKLVNFYEDTKKNSTLVQVYSLKSDSWKCFETIQYGFRCDQDAGVLFNGALHWFGGMMGNASSLMIVSMDISEERFDKLQLPMILPNQYYMNMGVLEDCMCVLVRIKETFEVWAMQDYGVSDSWTKRYTITYESLMCPWYVERYVELIGSLKNGEILFWDDTKNVIS